MNLSPLKRVLLFITGMIAVGFFLYGISRYFFPRRMWEGLFINLEYRDVGESLNACIGANAKVFAQDVFSRSNRYFSGWSCDKVGSPEVIYSLNFDPKREGRDLSECTSEAGEKIEGQHFNEDFRINLIEDLSRWEDPRFSLALCHFFEGAVENIAAAKTVHVHCDAGRDRTGAFTAMVAGLLAEKKGLNKDLVNNIIECDYEKNANLQAEKKGRMLRLMQDLEEKGGVQAFLQTYCQIPEPTVKAAADRFIVGQP